MSEAKAIVITGTWRDNGSIATRSVAWACGSSLEELTVAGEMAAGIARGHAEGQAKYLAIKEVAAYNALCPGQRETETRRLLKEEYQ